MTAVDLLPEISSEFYLFLKNEIVEIVSADS